MGGGWGLGGHTCRGAQFRPTELQGEPERACAQSPMRVRPRVAGAGGLHPLDYPPVHTAPLSAPVARWPGDGASPEGPRTSAPLPTTLPHFPPPSRWLTRIAEGRGRRARPHLEQAPLGRVDEGHAEGVELLRILAIRGVDLISARILGGI